MFVKIVRNPLGRSEVKGYTAIYQTERMHEENSDDPRYVRIFFEPSGIVRTLDKVDTEVFIMNDEGKTIDRYDWPEWDLEGAKVHGGEPQPPEPSPPTNAIAVPFMWYTVGSEVGDYKGWYEAPDKSWILFVDRNRCGRLFSERDSEAGAVK